MSSPFAEFVRRYGFYVVLCIAVCVAALSVIPGAHEIARRLYWEAQPLALLTIIVAAYRFPRLHQLFAFRVVAGIGLASYSLYLWQSIFLIGSLAAYAWLLIPCAAASYFFIEKPFIRWGRAYLARR
jgi:peptidoglycan/LPS O-acetylase OafA/YrhL